MVKHFEQMWNFRNYKILEAFKSRTNMTPLEFGIRKKKNMRNEKRDIFPRLKPMKLSQNRDSELVKTTVNNLAYRNTNENKETRQKFEVKSHN